MNNIMALGPLLVVVIGSLFVLLLDVFFKKEDKSYLGYISLVFLIACGAVCFIFWNRDYQYFDGTLALDNLALFFFVIFLVAVAFVVLLSLRYISLQDTNYGEIYSLLLLALSGMMIMASSSDLLVIFLGLEVLSVSSYALAGLKRNDEKSSEAAIKYFLLGSFASAFLVLGIALLYGAFLTTRISGIIAQFYAGTNVEVMALFGLGLLLVGLGFKIAMVPFHMWTPDVYQGAPTPITAFFSVGPKAVGFVVLLRLFLDYGRASFSSEVITWILWIMSVLTMVVGNLVALRQTNVKRILAYSSIAHAGYIMVAILAQDNAGLTFYLAAYLFMNIGAFSAVIALNKKGQEYLELDDYAGIGYKYPWIGATFSVFLLSLAGFPPTAGFLAKFYIFSAAVRQDLVPLVIIAVLASLISVFYYLRIVVYMYMREATRDVEAELDNPAVYLVLFLCLYGVLQLGIFPGNILSLIKQAVSSIAIL